MIKLHYITSTIEVTQNTFPDGTLSMRLPLPDNYTEEYCNNIPRTIEWYYESDSELFTLICIRRHFAQISDVKPSLFLPYIPHARMDRVKNPEDVFTLKYFAEVLNSLDFSEVLTWDAHSNVALALINNINNLLPRAIVNNILKNNCDENTILFFPDEGSMKRYSSLFDRPYAFGMKKRNWETGKILGLDIINKEIVKDKNILIVDDICSKGGTFFHAAEALKEAGAAKIDLYITHCETNVFNGKLIDSDLIDTIYTTNSIFKNIENTDKIIVVETRNNCI